MVVFLELSKLLHFLRFKLDLLSGFILTPHEGDATHRAHQPRKQGWRTSSLQDFIILYGFTLG
jgi:hypothetical protein